MLKKRVVATVILREGLAVQSIGFNKFLPLGKPEIVVEYLSQWGIDEIVLLDISATNKKQGPDFELIKECSKNCRVPMTIGGGVSTIDEIRVLMQNGADKIALNNVIRTNPEFVEEAVSVFGSQAIVASIDVDYRFSKYVVFDYRDKSSVTDKIEDYINMVLDLGIGEILVNAVHRDGSYKGYDINLIRVFSKLSSVPLVCSGGAKNINDLIQVFKSAEVSGASASNFYHFTEHSVIKAKVLLKNVVPTRNDGVNIYNDFAFDEDYRIQKLPEDYLRDLLFVKVEKEII